MAIQENIKRLREKHNLTQDELGEVAGVSGNAVWTWENQGKVPRMGAIQRMADHFGINKSDIIEDKPFFGVAEQSASYNTNPRGVAGHAKRMPYLGSIAAGEALEMIRVEEYINVPYEIADLYPNSFLVRVNGESMNKIVPPNALALIDPTIEVKNGDVVAVSINGFDATLKRFFHFKDGVALEPETYDDNYQTQFYNKEAIAEKPFDIKGKMVWFMAAFDQKF
ncbi:XRE family transcriptional regulator [Salibacterium salarium]|uniref:XRE family transcriptional regulator n=1 Tax=Salibacterium salarium TaxID=284579 RepID=A0A3R9QKA7_9BACI|nr:LexA family transcriptional regulator [Salibacterium salarium]RSL32635.1 XRE family transcriptional regulator [Salibacterium salarium]